MEDWDLGQKVYVPKIDDQDPKNEEIRVKSVKKAAVKV